MTNSIWLGHPDWPGYLFSPEGGCLSVVREKPRLIKPNLTRSGYVLYHLTKHYPNGSHRVFAKAAHRIVAQIYVPGFKPGLHVNHKNGIKTDNASENLEWVTPSENKLHAVHVLGQKPKRYAKLTIGQVSEIKTLLRDRPDLSQKKIGEMYGVSHGCVHLIHIGKNWKFVK